MSNGFKQAVIDVEWSSHKEHGLLPEHVTVEAERNSHTVGGCNTCGVGGQSVTDGWETVLTAKCPAGKNGRCGGEYLSANWDGQQVAVFLATL